MRTQHEIPFCATWIYFVHKRLLSWWLKFHKFCLCCNCDIDDSIRWGVRICAKLWSLRFKKEQHECLLDLNYENIILKQVPDPLCVERLSKYGHCQYQYPNGKVHGANMGPTWVLPAPGGTHVGHLNLVIWVCWLTSKGFPIVKITSNNSLIVIMGISILVPGKTLFILKWGPLSVFSAQTASICSCDDFFLVSMNTEYPKRVDWPVDIYNYYNT